MKFLVDAQLPVRLARFLETGGYKKKLKNCPRNPKPTTRMKPDTTLKVYYLLLRRHHDSISSRTIFYFN